MSNYAAPRSRFACRPAWRALVAAGPVFVTAWSLAWMYARLPDPVVVSSDDVLVFCAVLVPAMIIGFVAAFFPVLVLGSLLSALEGVVAPARSPMVWIATGGGVAAVFVQGHGSLGSVTGFALIATGTICAALTWRSHDRRRDEAEDAADFPTATA